MRWILVGIVGYVGLVIQTSVFRPGGLAIPIDGHWTRPDLVLIVALFIALYFQRHEVFIATWCLGLAADLVSVSGRLGVQALLYGALLTALSAVRGSLNRGWVLTQSALTFATVLVIHFGWYVATRYFGGAPAAILRSVEESALDAALTAILAPYVFWLLLRLRGPLGIVVEPYEV